MSAAEGGLEMVAAPADGWCEPETGVCHVGTADEATPVEASDENVAGDVPDAPGVTDALSVPAAPGATDALSVPAAPGVPDAAGVTER